jgi:ubiquinone/menaquinone biosynthesis C-methylase UbiE
MLEAAAMSARKEGLSNVDTGVMDAQMLDLPSDSFDTAISRFALMLVPDINEALEEVRRVLRRGGRFAAIVFESCPYLSIPHAIAGLPHAPQHRAPSTCLASSPGRRTSKIVFGACALFWLYARLRKRGPRAASPLVTLGLPRRSVDARAHTTETAF